jgi:hypothetical protein
MNATDLTNAEALEVLRRFQDAQKKYPYGSPRWVAASKTINALCKMMAARNA